MEESVAQWDERYDGGGIARRDERFNGGIDDVERPTQQITPMEVYQSFGMHRPMRTRIRWSVECLIRSLDQILESATSSSACNGGNNKAEMECHPLGMFRLGDTFVREAIPSAIRAAREIRKGFGKKSARGGSEDDDSDKIEGGG